ncbi:MAG: response regulator [Chloroflexi bacterium]|nr:MAG: response regulator [Chloroflexota bacterium]
MSKSILWIDDDYYAIQGLFRPLVVSGYQVDVAISALEGYRKAQNWKTYDLIVVDLIIPVSQLQESAPSLVESWGNEEEYSYVGLGLVKWLLTVQKAQCPVAILSIVPDPVATYNLSALGIAGFIRKDGLLPSRLKAEILKILEGSERVAP